LTSKLTPKPTPKPLAGLAVFAFFSVAMNTTQRGWVNWYRMAKTGEVTTATVTEVHPENHPTQLRARLILGSEKFMRKIQATLTGNKREQPSLRRATDRPDWTRVMAAVEQTKGARWRDFADKRGDTGRDLALYLARKHCQLKLAELGTLAGGMDYASVSIAIQRFHRRLKRNKFLAKRAARAEELMFNVEI
jgi:hypothetical protein